MSWQPPSSGSQKGTSPAKEEKQDLDYYELLQVDRDAHPTIIRYAYRFLAAMYHPDNGETGDADKFRIISEAWRTLSDEGKRAAYDLTLGIKEQHKADQAKSAPVPTHQFGKDSMPQFPKTNLTWNELELRLAILQILLAARRKRVQSGGGSGKTIMDILHIEDVTEVEFALWYLREKGYVESGERVYMITVQGLDYLTEQLSKTQVLGGGNAAEEKTKVMMEQAAGTGSTGAIPLPKS